MQQTQTNRIKAKLDKAEQSGFINYGKAQILKQSENMLNG